MKLPSPICRHPTSGSGASWWGESRDLTSHQIRCRLSGRRCKGLMRKHSRTSEILMNKETAYMWVSTCTAVCVCREQMHALVSPQCAFALITEGMWQRHSRRNGEIKGSVCLKEFQLCGGRNVSVQYFPLSQKCFISFSGLQRAYLVQTHILVHKLTFKHMFDFFVCTLSRCWLLSYYFTHYFQIQ